MTTITTSTTSAHWTGADLDNRWTSDARELATALAARAADLDRIGGFAHDGMQAVRDGELVAMLVPSELGGGGATHAEACAALATLAQGDPATALTLSMHTHLVAAQVWRHHHDLPAPVLPRVAGERIVLVSTGASDWIDSSGTAVQVDGGFRVSARKGPSSGAPAGNVLITSVRWDDAPEGPQVLHLAVPFTADGVSIEETWDTMGMRATGSHTVVLDDVFVPEAAVSLMRPAGEWHPVWNVVIGAAMPLIMSVYVGVAEAAAERAVAIARRRSDAAVVAPVVARMLDHLHTAQDAVGRMIAMSDDLRFESTIEHTAAVLSRKRIAADAAIQTVRLALEAAGGAGFSSSTGIERLYRDVHGAIYHPLAPVRQEQFTGRLALGLDPVGGG